MSKALNLLLGLATIVLAVLYISARKPSVEPGSAADAVAGRDRQKGRDLTLGSVTAYKSVLRKSNGNSGLDSFLRGGAAPWLLLLKTRASRDSGHLSPLLRAQDEPLHIGDVLHRDGGCRASCGVCVRGADDHTDRSERQDCTPIDNF